LSGDRVAGPAFTVRCPPGDNLMLPAAIYRAEPGSVIVVQAGDVDYAMAAGNVCAVAQVRLLRDARAKDAREAREAGQTLDAREAGHRALVEAAILNGAG
jgi:4-hydroxy-4-methyl-2-oxoglutarate aldolase